MFYLPVELADPEMGQPFFSSKVKVIIWSDLQQNNCLSGNLIDRRS
jgi:hypothetical protein